jgi:hypothetical protein
MTGSPFVMTGLPFVMPGPDPWHLVTHAPRFRTWHDF